MRNPFRIFYRTAPDCNATPKPIPVLDTSLPPHTQGLQLQPSTDPSYERILSLKRCLIWRMAIDWKLKSHVSTTEKPSDDEYSWFERCCEIYTRVLGHHYHSQELIDKKNLLMRYIFIPGCDGLRIGCNVLEFFMFSVRRALWCQGYVNKGQRITCKRDEVLLLRLVIDSIILVDLVTDPQSTFAWKLKAKCTQMHQEKFSWLLDPATIDMAHGHRAPSIWSRVTTSGYWAQVEWLMRQSMRPCAALMDPSVSVEYEVRRAYFFPKANLLQQPEFFLRCTLPHRDLLPKFVVCNNYQWWNPDQNRNICVYSCACQSGSRNV